MGTCAVLRSLTHCREVESSARRMRKRWLWEAHPTASVQLTDVLKNRAAIYFDGVDIFTSTFLVPPLKIRPPKTNRAAKMIITKITKTATTPVLPPLLLSAIRISSYAC